MSGQLTAAAVAEDGLIEAVVMPEKRFVLSVQWHPEFNFKLDDSSFQLFKAFVQACNH
ncbi:gamma-glutamyl-gamma-aminobutyrate hydrolase family protein [Paenibacillus macerans]|uniref:gamma-glutamyl-gamma-aminobutyrate hydrolase family protein n=1 Tax=Paenibacillus macerans TaxID=44252 RepID=UPI00203FF666|nr:gamma-glutamyl-gamma-aminobutyrate hydrolase family protein [Paenibacillus macerans]